MIKRKRPGEDGIHLPMDIAECKDGKQKFQATVQFFSVNVSESKIEPLVHNSYTSS